MLSIYLPYRRFRQFTVSILVLYLLIAAFFASVNFATAAILDEYDPSIEYQPASKPEEIEINLPVIDPEQNNISTSKQSNSLVIPSVVEESILINSNTKPNWLGQLATYFLEALGAFDLPTADQVLTGFDRLLNLVINIPLAVINSALHTINQTITQQLSEFQFPKAFLSIVPDSWEFGFHSAANQIKNVLGFFTRKSSSNLTSSTDTLSLADSRNSNQDNIFATDLLKKIAIPASLLGLGGISLMLLPIIKSLALKSFHFGWEFLRAFIASSRDLILHGAMEVNARLDTLLNKTTIDQARMNSNRLVTSTTKRDAGDWREDALIVGAGLAVIAGIVLTPVALATIETAGGFTVAAGVTTSYIIKETPIAMAETAWECSQPFQCSSFTDGGITLAFNYLPNITPDFEADQGVIALKNQAIQKIGSYLKNTDNDVLILGKYNLSFHAIEKMSARNISIKDIELAMNEGETFKYFHKREWKTGYYHENTKIFVGLGDRITTVINEVDRQYINNIRGIK